MKSYICFLTFVLFISIMTIGNAPGNLTQDNTSACRNNGPSECESGRCCPDNGTSGAGGGPGGGGGGSAIGGDPFSGSRGPSGGYFAPGDPHSWLIGNSGIGMSYYKGNVYGTIVSQTGQTSYHIPLCNFDSNGAFNFGLTMYYDNHNENYYLDNKDGKTLLGPGWVLNTEMRLETHPDAPDRVMYRDAAGSREQFLPVTGEDYTWKTNVYNTINGEIERNTNDYTLTLKDGKNNLGFLRSNGKLSWLEDRNGNRLEMTYDANNRPSRLDVSHSSNDQDSRYISFSDYQSYTISGNTVYRLKEITTPDSKKIYFEYESTSPYRLIKIKDHYNRTISEFSYLDDSGTPTSQLKQVKGLTSTSSTSSPVVFHSYDYEKNSSGIYLVTKKKDKDNNSLVELEYGDSDITVDTIQGTNLVIESHEIRDVSKVRYIDPVTEEEYRSINQDFTSTQYGGSRRYNQKLCMA